MSKDNKLKKRNKTLVHTEILNDDAAAKKQREIDAKAVRDIMQAAFIICNS